MVTLLRALCALLFHWLGTSVTLSDHQIIRPSDHQTIRLTFFTYRRFNSATISDIAFSKVHSGLKPSLCSILAELYHADPISFSRASESNTKRRPIRSPIAADGQISRCSDARNLPPPSCRSSDRQIIGSSDHRIIGLSDHPPLRFSDHRRQNFSCLAIIAPSIRPSSS